MFVKITSSGGRQYVKLVEAFRDDTGVPRQRVIATLGRIEAVRAGETNALINGLLRAADQPTIEDDVEGVEVAHEGEHGDDADDGDDAEEREEALIAREPSVPVVDQPTAEVRHEDLGSVADERDDHTDAGVAGKDQEAAGHEDQRRLQHDEHLGERELQN